MDTLLNTLVPHPGEFIREELEARGWTQRDLAFVLGLQESAVNPILNGGRGISPAMAKSLADAFDVDAQFFMNLQHSFDLSKAPQPDPGVAKRGRLQEYFPVREMIKRGWLADIDAGMLELQIALFFNAGSAQELPYLRHAAKKTYYEETPPAQLAWLFRVRQIAESMTAPSYSNLKLSASLTKLASLMTAPEEVRHVPRILNECGVKLVIVEALPGSQIDGVCFWLNGTPVIGMTIRRDKIDNFWFVLRHEIEHVLLRHGTNKECIDEDLGGEEPANQSEEEKLANIAGREYCVKSADLEDFILRVQPYFSEERVLLFAQRINVHPGIVVGQLQRRLDRWNFLTKHQSKIRQFLTSSATTDGWGLIYPVDL